MAIVIVVVVVIVVVGSGLLLCSEKCGCRRDSGGGSGVKLLFCQNRHCRGAWRGGLSGGGGERR